MNQLIPIEYEIIHKYWSCTISNHRHEKFGTAQRCIAKTECKKDNFTKRERILKDKSIFYQEIINDYINSLNYSKLLHDLTKEFETVTGKPPLTEFKEIIDELLMTLEIKRCCALVLRYNLSKMSFKEIGTKMRLSNGRVQQLNYNALRTLINSRLSVFTPPI